jgi:hypothetical protein
VEPSGQSKGYFELKYIKDGKSEPLCGPDAEVLHELLD